MFIIPIRFVSIRFRDVYLTRVRIISGLCFDYKSQYIDCADVTGCGLGNDSVAWDFQVTVMTNL